MSRLKRIESKEGDFIADRYRLKEAIGEGGMGRVFRAYDETLSRTVAVKILLPQYAVQEHSRRRFIREAKVTGTLNHSSAIRIYDFGQVGNCLYLVMELLNGVTLRKVIAERFQLPPEDAIEIAYCVADVLVASHQLPLIHRDLKPENIMLAASDVIADVKVLDFGMAFIADDEEAEELGMGRLTKEGLAGGTPTYMSPEQVQGASVTGAADVYALGCILYEMLAGDPPFDGPMMKVLTKQMYQPAPDLRPFCPEAPQALIELVARMLTKRPSERPSAETVRTRLASLAPHARGVRERSRDHTFLSTREARMVSAPTIPRPEAELPPPSLSIEVRGAIDDELALALAATGVRISSDGGSGPLDAIYIADAASVDIQDVCKSSTVPVVVASASVAIDAVSKLLRAGVAEIVTLPVSSDELTKKLRRAVRKKR